MEQVSLAQPGIRNLVTGANGFVGRYLVAALLARGERVVALTRSTPSKDSPAESRTCDLVEGDIGSLLREVRPACIYHLAGFSDAGASVRHPEIAHRDNLVATERLLDGLLTLDPRPRVLHVSSGLVYGAPSEGTDLFDETSPLHPQTPYAESKIAAERAVERFGRETAVEIVRARPFNHTGPGQSPRFAIPGFAQRLALIAAGAEPAILKTGNLDVERDIADVRDVVAAYLLLMERGVAGSVYNIATGVSTSMRSIVEKMIELSGLRVELQTSEDLVRVGEPLRVRMRVGIDRLRHLGWAPRFTLEETLADTLASWGLAR